MTHARERLGNVGPDEAGTAGDQYSHGQRLRTVTPGSWPEGLTATVSVAGAVLELNEPFVIQPVGWPAA